MNRGTIVSTAANGLGGGDITFNQFGRIILRNLNGTVYNLTGTMDFSAGALGEFSVDAQQGDVRAVFVPLARLQEELGIVKPVVRRVA